MSSRIINGLVYFKYLVTKSLAQLEAQGNLIKTIAIKTPWKE